MDTLQLNRIMNKYKWMSEEFCGVIPIDYLPKHRVERPCSFIVNSDKSSLPGQHWFAIHLPKNGSIEYFDSFGFKPLNNEVYEFFKLNENNWKYNKFQIQNIRSKSCGKICALFLLYRNKGLTYKDFINIFSKNTEINELLVKQLYKRLFQ